MYLACAGVLLLICFLCTRSLALNSVKSSGAARGVQHLSKSQFSQLHPPIRFPFPSSFRGEGANPPPPGGRQRRRRRRKLRRIFRIVGRSGDPSGELGGRADTSKVRDIQPFCIDKSELDRMARMREMVVEQLPYEQRYTFEDLQARVPDAYGNLRMLRFLRKSKNQDAGSSAKRFVKYLRWRKEFQVDSVIRPLLDSESGYNDILDRRVVAFINENFGAEIRNEGQLKNVGEVHLDVGRWRGDVLLKAIDDGSLTLTAFLYYWTLLYERIHLRLYERTLLDGQLAFIDGKFKVLFE